MGAKRIRGDGAEPEPPAIPSPAATKRFERALQEEQLSGVQTVDRHRFHHAALAVAWPQHVEDLVQVRVVGSGVNTVASGRPPRQSVVHQRVDAAIGAAAESAAASAPADDTEPVAITEPGNR